MALPDERTPPENALEYPPVLRSETAPVAFRHSFPIFGRPRDLGLTSAVLVSAVALAVEGWRQAARSSRKRVASRPPDVPAEHGTMTYEWTQITYERYERS
jgi:hypothetical protein